MYAAMTRVKGMNEPTEEAAQKSQFCLLSMLRCYTLFDCLDFGITSEFYTNILLVHR